MTVEVFSNLVHIPSHLWSVFSRPGVRLATSYYADQARHHEAVTGRRGSYQRTMTNIVEAVRRSIPLRVGLIGVLNGQRVEQARQQLETLGVINFSADRLRQVGRGVRDQRPDSLQLCGGCARGKVAVAGNGDVWPCVFARWMPMGNVQATPLREIVTVSKMEAAQAKVSAPWSSTEKCAPETPKCSPETQCQPANDPCQPHCPPGYHSEPKRCWPYYYQERKQ
jgi:MoaA/NifB/PqqE/SkfB family radical SAM enzyme